MKLAKSKKLSKIILKSTLLLAFMVSLASPAISQQIITNGKTNTKLSIDGNRTYITTTTVSGNNAFNSFYRFNVHKGNVVNLVLPDGTDNLINLIYGERSYIDGTLNSVKESINYGKIGTGNIFFANPYGMIVSSSGVINVGSLTAVTPTMSFMNKFFSSPGKPNPDSVKALTDSVYTNEYSPNGATYVPNNALINKGQSIINNGTIILKDNGNFSNFLADTITNSGKIISVGDIVNLTGTNINLGADSLITAGKVVLLANKINVNTGSGDRVTANGINIFRRDKGNVIIADSKNANSSDLQFTPKELDKLYAPTDTSLGIGNLRSVNDIKIFSDVTRTGTIWLTAANDIYFGSNIFVKNPPNNLGKLHAGAGRNLTVKAYKTLSADSYVALGSDFGGSVSIGDYATIKSNVPDEYLGILLKSDYSKVSIGQGARIYAPNKYIEISAATDANVGRSATINGTISINANNNINLAPYVKLTSNDFISESAGNAVNIGAYNFQKAGQEIDLSGKYITIDPTATLNAPIIKKNYLP